MRKSTISFLLLLSLPLLLMLGCISERTATMPTNEGVLLVISHNLDSDGTVDVAEYAFKPIIVDVEQNIIMQKFVTVTETETALDIISTNHYSDSNISVLEQLIFQFDNERTDMENICKDVFGISKTTENICTNHAECADKCTNTQCKKYRYANELLGYWIYDFLQNSRMMDANIRDVKNAIIFLKDATPEEKKQVMSKLNKIIDYTHAININPLLNDNTFAMCKQIGYNNSKIIDMLNIMGGYDRRPVAHAYVVNLKFAFNGKDHSELNVIDNLPKSLAILLRNISLVQNSIYNKNQSQVIWPTIAFDSHQKYLLGYSFVTTQNTYDDILVKQYWPTSNVSIKVVSIEKNPLIKYIIEISEMIYLQCKSIGYYPALAIVTLFWDIVICIAMLCIKIVLNVIIVVFRHSGIKNGVVRGFGNAIQHAKYYFIVGIFFFIVATILFFNSDQIIDNQFMYNKIIENLMKNQFGMFSYLSFFLSLHIFYILFEDKLKGLVIGKSYYANLADLSPKANALRFKILNERVAVLKELVIASKEIDTNEEKEVLISIPLDRIEELLKKFGSEKVVKELMETYINRVNMAITRMSEKSNIVKDHWFEWDKEISEKLAEHDGVTFTAMFNIPSVWRVWAANRFVAEHEVDRLYVDAEGIKKTVAKTTILPVAISSADLLKKLVLDNNIIGGIILKKGNIDSAYSVVGNQTLESILSWRISNYAKTLGEKIFNLGYMRIEISGATNSVVFVKEFDKEGIIFTQNEKMKDALAEFQKKLKDI
ncbi:MAG: hypothetical protein AB1391_01895 [Candidatus Micrarchaeota archaeon]